MCRFAARCGVPPAPFCTPTRGKQKTRSLVPAMCFNKLYGFRSVLSNTNGRVRGLCLDLCSNIAGQNRGKRLINKAIHIDCLRSGQISSLPLANISSFPSGKHIDRKTEREQYLFDPSFVTGAMARRRCRLVPSSPADFRFQRKSRLVGKKLWIFDFLPI